MGRNPVPEVKPPAPSPAAGDVPEGNQSPARRRPPRPSPAARAPSPLRFLLRRAAGGRGLESRDRAAPPTAAGREGRLRRDVTETARLLYIGAFWLPSVFCGGMAAFAGLPVSSFFFRAFQY